MKKDQAQALQQGLSNPAQGTAPGQPGQSIGAGAAGTSILGTPQPGAAGAANGTAVKPSIASATAERINLRIVFLRMVFSSAMIIRASRNRSGESSEWLFMPADARFDGGVPTWPQ